MLPRPVSAACLGLESSADRSTDGTFTLRWGPTEHEAGCAAAAACAMATADSPRFRLEETALDGDGTVHTRYEGRDTARFQSGKRDGRYRYTLSLLDGSGAVACTASPLTVTVIHHSLTRALAFFTLGALVFAAIAARLMAGPDR